MENVRRLKTLLTVALFAFLPTAQGGDLLIQNGTLFTLDGLMHADVRIRGETILEIGELLPAPSDERTIDAEGLLILPGGIDPHVHLAPATAAFPFADDFESGSRAALAGGITTVGHMAFPADGELPTQTLSRERKLIEGKTIADVFVHTTILQPTEEAIADLPELVKLGQPSIKIFMPFESFEPEFPNFLKLMKAASNAGIRVAIHCEDAHTINDAIRTLVGKGQTSLDHYPQSRPVVSEVVAIQRAVAMAETTNASIYIVHLSAARALEAATAGRHRLPVAVETRPLYLHLTQDVYQKPDGGLFVGMPPIRAQADSDALWEGIRAGTIDTVATDHAPWTREQKLAPDHTIATPRPGVNNLQHMLPMLFSEGVVTGRISLEQFVAVTAENAAKLFGLYPKKGAIAPGSDADLVIWDRAEKRTIEDADVLSKTGYSIYSGTEVTGWPHVTIRRGEIVYEGGKVHPGENSGQVIVRNPIGSLSVKE
jgi:dihydropyrimidinase